MKARFLFGSALLSVLLLAAGCSTPLGKRLNRLELGMSQAQVKKILGDDYVVKASRVDAKGSTLHLWEYRDQKTEESYSIYFKDGVLAQWGTPAKLDFPELFLPRR
jgi:hypothetical protein